jgi:hypothetical protein
MERREALQILTALPAATRIVRAEPAAREVIVVEFPADQHPSARELQNLHVMLAQVWPKNRIVMLAGGVRLSFAAGGV